MSDGRIGFVTSGDEQSHIERSWRSTSSSTSLPTASFTIARAASAEMFAAALGVVLGHQSRCDRS